MIEKCQIIRLISRQQRLIRKRLPLISEPSYESRLYDMFFYINPYYQHFLGSG